jgi:single-strand DNA-binding protein
MEELLTKGKEVLIEGKLTNRSWEDKDGNKRYITEIVTSDFLILTPKDLNKTDKLPF